MSDNFKVLRDYIEKRRKSNNGDTQSKPSKPPGWTRAYYLSVIKLSSAFGHVSAHREGL